MKLFPLIACAFWGGLLLPINSFGLGIRITNQDGTAVARGNAFTATADNPSALYYNPAGITQLEGSQLQAGVYALVLDNRVESLTGEKTDSLAKLLGAPQMYVTLNPEKGPFSYGLGVFSPFGLGVYWPENAPFRALGTKAFLLYSSVNPVIAWQVSESLSIAAGPSIDYGNLDLRSGFGANPDDRVRFRGWDVGLGFSAGLLWKPHEQHSFGLTYRSGMRLEFEGHVSSEITGLGRLRDDATFDADLPQTVIVGWSYRPTPKWNLEFDLDWADWDVLNTSYLRTSAGRIPTQFDWSSSLIYKFGVTRQFDRFSVSAGYWYAEKTVPDAHFKPIVPDQDLHALSAGVGWTGKKWDCHATYQLAYGPTRTVRGSEMVQGQSADGDYEWLSHALALSIRRRF